MREYLFGLATERINGAIHLIPKCVLLLLSLLYGIIVRVLIFLSGLQARRLSCKVISVGNITLGGTGKTPLVEYIARYLKEQGHKIAVVSRGYRGADEPYMLSRKLKDIPVIVDADRVRGIGRGIKDYSVDTVILDDAMQQWGIKKDLEVVVIDAGYPFGNRCLIPRGILREPISGLKRADVFLLNGRSAEESLTRLKGILRQINPRAAIFESMRKPLCFLLPDGKPVALSALEGKKVILFSGIGNPSSFEETIRSLGINIAGVFEFPDHHYYTQKELDDIYRSCIDRGAAVLITTEKDSARLTGLSISEKDPLIYVLSISLTIKDEDKFRDRLLQLYSG